MDVGAVHGWKGRGSPYACVDARARQRPHEWQRAVDSPAPEHVAVEELIRVMRPQPCFPLAVANLLTPVRLHGGAVVMPHQRRRSEADLPAPPLQPPAHIDVIPGAKVGGIEA